MEKMKNLFLVLVYILISNSCSEGEFIADTAAAINLSKPENDALCEGGEALTNNKVLVPFSWTVEGEETFESFEIEVYDKADPETIIAQSDPVKGDVFTTKIALERGNSLQWKVIGQVSGKTDPVSSETWAFYSESTPTDNLAPLPSRISIDPNNQNEFDITWKNDREDTENLTYKVSRTTHPISESTDDLTNPSLYSTLTPNSTNEMQLPFSSLNGPGDYIFRVETIKVIGNGVQYSTFSYKQFPYTP
jgi:hypothetical protein